MRKKSLSFKVVTKSATFEEMIAFEFVHVMQDALLLFNKNVILMKNQTKE
jgi:hypothetical protein